MWIYAISGLVVGFVIGMFINAWLLRGIPKDKYVTDKSLRLRFGLLNWGVALLGLVLAVTWVKNL